MAKLAVLFSLLLMATLTTCAPVPPSSEELRLIQLSPDLKLWMTPDQLDELDNTRHKIAKLGVGYFDITDFQEPVTPVAKFSDRRMAFPTSPRFQSTVNPLVAQVSPNNLRNTITTLSSFTNRYGGASHSFFLQIELGTEDLTS